MVNNLDVRALARRKGVCLYEIAAELNISEPTIMRWLRANLSDDRKADLIKAIDRVAAQHAEQATAAATE